LQQQDAVNLILTCVSDINKETATHSGRAV